MIKPSTRLAIAALSVASVAFAACGGDDSSSDTTAAQTTATTSATNDAPGGTRTVPTPNGDVDVPEQPTRIVSVQAYATSTLFDLGITPIGIYDEGEEYVSTRYLDQWQPIEKIGSAGEFNLEAITALQPDLIVGVNYPFITDQYASLAAIAPTVLVDSEVGWRDQVAAVADAVGASDRVAELSDAYDDEAARLSSTYASQLEASHWAFIQGGFDAGNYWIYGPGASVVDIAEDAGVQLATASAETTDSSRSVSYEQADLLDDADVIAFYADAQGAPLNDLDQLFAIPTFTGLPAVAAGHTLPMADFLPGSYGDATGVLASVESMLQQL